MMSQGGLSPCRSNKLERATSLSSFVLLAGLEGNLQHAVAQAVAVEASDCHGGLVVVGHGDEAEALTFVGGEVADDFDIGDGTERPKELPQDALIRLGGQVVHKDAPAGSGRTGEVDPSQAGHAVNSDGGESGEENRRATMGVILKFQKTLGFYVLTLETTLVRKMIDLIVGSLRTPSPFPSAVQ